MLADMISDSGSSPEIHTLVLSELIGRAAVYETLSTQLADRVCAAHDRLARDLLRRFDGREVEKAQRFLLLFARPLDAVHYCLAYHDGLRDLSRELGRSLQGRAAIHLGEVFLRPTSPEHRERGSPDVDVEGPARALVARLILLAEAGQVLLTKTVYELSRRAAVGESESKLRWTCHDEMRLEGMDEPVEIFEVAMDGMPPLPAPGTVRRLEIRESDRDRMRAGQPVPRRPHFILQRQLGETPFGVRWLAVHEKTHVEQVFHFCSDEAGLARLKDQAEVYRRLKTTLGQRDDISRIFDGNFDEPPYFLVSEHVEGDDLPTWAEDELESTSLEVRLEIVARTAGALAAIHSAGVSHGSLRASNVRILPGGEGAMPKVRLAQIGRSLDSAGAEERHELLKKDARALGALLYQMVAGDLRRLPGPFWERPIHDPLLRRDIARLIDPEAENPSADVAALPELLRTLPRRRVHRAAEERREEIRLRRRRWLRAAVLVLIVALIMFVLGTRLG